jgi:hypothetical protein
MPFATSGIFPTEFDATTDAILATVQALGATDAELVADQEFVVELFIQVGNPAGPPDADWMGTMDCVFIGLIYHRHMPFYNEDGERFRPERGDADYVFTLSAVSNALARQVGATPEQVTAIAIEAMDKLMPQMKPVEDLHELHTQVMALMILGMLVHRLMPHTNIHP